MLLAILDVASKFIILLYYYSSLAFRHSNTSSNPAFWQRRWVNIFWVFTILGHHSSQDNKVLWKCLLLMTLYQTNNNSSYKCITIHFLWEIYKKHIYHIHTSTYPECSLICHYQFQYKAGLGRSYCTSLLIKILFFRSVSFNSQVKELNDMSP